jgi:hypothetical protein
MNRATVFLTICATWIMAFSSWSMDGNHEFYAHLKKGFASLLEAEAALKINQEMKISIKTIDGNKFALQVKPIDSIESVVEKIASKQGIPKEQIRLSYYGQWLGEGSELRKEPKKDLRYQFREMNTPLLHYRIEEDATVLMLVKSEPH